MRDPQRPALEKKAGILKMGLPASRFIFAPNIHRLTLANLAIKTKISVIDVTDFPVTL